MRQILVTVYKFSELTTSIQEKIIEEYLTQHQKELENKFTLDFFMTKGFFGAELYFEDYYLMYGVRLTLKPHNLPLLNSYFSIPRPEIINQIELDSDFMVNYCAQPDVKIEATEDTTELVTKLKSYWADCCSEFVTALRQQVSEAVISDKLTYLDYDYLEDGTMVTK